MVSRLLVNEEILDCLRKCYLSDIDHMLKFHVYGESGDIESCIYKTVSDLVLNNVFVYSIYKDNEFIGYFGDEKGQLTGFFIMPDKRKSLKKEFWDTIVNHFKTDFKIGVFSKNTPAIEFLKKNNCMLVEKVMNNQGLIFKYSKERI